MNCKDGTEQALRQRQFRAAMGNYPTGVTVVATRRADGGVVGLTINSFNSVSLQPLLVTWNLSNGSQWLQTFLRCTHYSVNVLADAQVALARQFARRENQEVDATPWRVLPSGAPLLRGAVAHFECVNAQQHGVGDHTLFVGRVHQFDHDAERAPLLFHAGGYCSGQVLRAAQKL